MAPTDYHHEQAEQLVVKSEKKLADGDCVHLTKPLLAHTSSTYTGRQTSRHTHAHPLVGRQSICKKIKQQQKQKNKKQKVRMSITYTGKQTSKHTGRLHAC